MASADIPDPATNFKAYQASLFKALVSATSAANALPPNDLGFYRSLDRDFAKNLDSAGSRVLDLSNRLLQQASNDTGIVASKYEDIDDVVDRYGSAVDVMDSLLEKADIWLDEYLGRNKKNDDSVKQKAPEVAQISAKSNSGKLEYKYLHASNVVRPQLKFKDRVDNLSSTPFQRKIVVKPHAMVPLDHGLSADAMETEDGIPRSLPHPYEYEIHHITYPEHMFEKREPQQYLPFDSTSATWVDNDESLQAMMDHLRGYRELAIDLEHHNYRSYQGFTCLMQLSTRDEDFIIDTLELRDRLWQLNDFFADPTIVKVLHGAESDIIWLQRDFGLYIVNLFDTYFATKVLEFPHHSLAYLLQKYCNFIADKKYQLADWRIRPLPQEMLDYARADTHYLLYIYDCVRDELLEKSGANENLLRSVLQRSAELALTKHEKPTYDVETGLGPGGWSGLLRKWNNPMNEQQFAVFKALHHWRDHVAREEDESTRYILPNHMLFALVERMPTESAGVIGCCNPCPPTVRMNAQAVALLIQRARMDGLRSLEEGKSKANQAITDAAAAKPEVTTVSSARKQAKVVQKVDPATFDLEKVNQQRQATAATLTKPMSVLFGTDTSSSSASEETAKQLAEEIRSTIKLILPIDTLKIKRVKSVADITPAAEEASAEHVYVPAQERVTTPAKRKENDVIVVGHFPKRSKNDKRS
ncbi:ribonuclease H-like domain-containing protein [Radiomyces spectabilis]|uniref:ribonuclease H-like domain-containing protein n=1 Tax=Radiomyces spectabilis TaxID=64574 RepID=UPI0022205AD4|nr:ribonuclease H-like domain-containing protein [Radiomyces spectabilis]KAI8384297.1 ribonuclease H-like domain-containing protein [Radiomyces spectabilis]